MTSNADRFRRIAVVSVDGVSQSELASYLTSVGFDVHECDEVPVPSAFAAIILIGNATSALVVRVRTWLKLARTQRAIVVTAKPAALRELVAAHGDRLIVLAAPAFGWDVVDALRATGQPSTPHGA